MGITPWQSFQGIQQSTQMMNMISGVNDPGHDQLAIQWSKEGHVNVAWYNPTAGVSINKPSTLFDLLFETPVITYTLFGFLNTFKPPQ